MSLCIAVVDDREEDASDLKRDILSFFGRANNLPEVACFSGTEELMAGFRPKRYDLLFLDILMDGMDGISAAKKIRATDASCLIVFFTASDEYAFDAFPVHPFDYLLKPYTIDRLDGVLREALRVLSDDGPELTVRVPHDEYRIPLDKIVSIVAQGHIVQITTTNRQQIRCIMTFRGIEDSLAGDNRFLGCNRGVLVNMDHVLSLDGDTLRMKNGESFTLRVRKRTELVKQFSQYQISRLRKDVQK